MEEIGRGRGEKKRTLEDKGRRVLKGREWKGPGRVDRQEGRGDERKK